MRETPRLNELNSDGGQIVYIKRKRFLRRLNRRHLFQPRDSELQFTYFPSNAFRFYLDKEVGKFVDFPDRRFDDTLVQGFEGRIIIHGYPHQLFERVKRNKRRFTLSAGGIEIVETDFPEN